MVAKWKAPTDSPQFEVEARYLLDALYVANAYLILNPDSRNIFDGRKDKRNERIAASQEKQRV